MVVCDLFRKSCLFCFRHKGAVNKWIYLKNTARCYIRLSSHFYLIMEQRENHWLLTIKMSYHHVINKCSYIVQIAFVQEFWLVPLNFLQILHFFILGPINTILDKSIIFYTCVNNRPVTYSMVTSVRWAAIFKKILTRYHSIRRVRASAVECRYNAVE